MTIVGTAEVLVLPNLSQFNANLETQLRGINLPNTPGLGQGLPVGTNVQAAFQDVGAATDELDAKFAKFASDTETVGSRSTNSLTTFTNLVGASFGRLTGSTQLIGEEVARLGEAGVQGAAGMEGVGAASGAATAGILAAAAAALGGTIEFERWGDQVFRLQQLTGATSQQASQLAFAFQSEGANVEAVGTAFARFGRNLEAGTTNLSQYGLEVSRTKSGQIDLYNTFLDLADAMQRLGPGAEADTLAIQALGRGGAQLVPILVQGRQAVQDLLNAAPKDLVFSDAQTARAHAFSVEIHQSGLELKSLAVDVGSVVVPVLNVLVGTLDKVVGGVEGLISKIAHLPGISQVIRGDAIFLDDLQQKLGIATDKTQSLSSAQTDAATTTGLLDQQVKQLTTTMNQMASAADAVVTGEQSVASADSTTSRALGDLTKSYLDYQALLKVNGEDTAKYAQAVRSLRDGLLALEQANNDVAKSALNVEDKERAYNEAVYKNGINSIEARRAAQDLADAHVNQDAANVKVADSTDTVSKAHQDMADASAGSAEATARLASAQQAVQDKSAAYQTALVNEASANAQLATALAEVGGKTADGAQKTGFMVQALEHVRDSLAPNSPYRKNLQDTIDQLRGYADALDRIARQAGIPGSGLVPPGSTPIFAPLQPGQTGPPTVTGYLLPLQPGQVGPPTLTGPGGISTAPAAPAQTTITVNQAPGQDPGAVVQAIDAYMGGAPSTPSGGGGGGSTRLL